MISIQKSDDKIVFGKLKRLAMEFNMEFDKHIFKKNIVNKQDCILLQFITGSPIPPRFNKFGITLKQRAENIDDFLSSDKSAYYGDGLVVDIAETSGTIKAIKNQKIKKRLMFLLNSFNTYSGEAVVLGKPENAVEKNKITGVLYHEWIHVLVEYNKLTFRDWRYNEAFTVYLEHYLKTTDNKDIEYLKGTVKKASHKKGYGMVTRRMGKFIKLFAGKDTPEERMVVLYAFRQRRNM